MSSLTLKGPDASPAGDWQEWAAKWQGIGKGSHACLYRPLSEPPANSHSELHRAYYLELKKSLAALHTTRASGVELGAGRGTTSQYLAADGHKVTLVDLAEGGLKLAIENWRRYGIAPPPRCVIADLTNTGLEEASYDLCYSVGTLEHFEDVRPMLAESLRLLRVGGLMWHIIVQCEGGDPKMTRVKRKPIDYYLAMRSLGQFASCAPFTPQTPDVLLLKCWKR